MISFVHGTGKFLGNEFIYVHMYLYKYTFGLSKGGGQNVKRDEEISFSKLVGMQWGDLFRQFFPRKNSPRCYTYTPAGGSDESLDLHLLQRLHLQGPRPDCPADILQV